MCRAIYFALVSVALFGAISCAAIDNEPASVNIDDIESYLEQNSGVDLQELNRSEVNGGEAIRYTYGKSVAGKNFVA